MEWFIGRLSGISNLVRLKISVRASAGKIPTMKQNTKIHAYDLLSKAQDKLQDVSVRIRQVNSWPGED